jgi:ABC-type dipeptide/oligopeptide/nickel transport system permease component
MPIASLTAADKEQIRIELGLDKPLPIQYFSWMGVVMKGSLGVSFFSK